MYFLLAFFAGFSIVVTLILGGKLAMKVGPTNGIVVNYSAGTIAAIIIILIFGEQLPMLSMIESAPSYYYFGGVIGVLTVFLLNTSVVKIPAVYIVVLPFVGQIITSAILDYIFLGHFSVGKLIGGLLFFIGLMINNGIDKKYEEA